MNDNGGGGCLLLLAGLFVVLMLVIGGLGWVFESQSRRAEANATQAQAQAQIAQVEADAARDQALIGVIDDQSAALTTVALTLAQVQLVTARRETWVVAGQTVGTVVLGAVIVALLNFFGRLLSAVAGRQHALTGARARALERPRPEQVELVQERAREIVYAPDKPDEYWA